MAMRFMVLINQVLSSDSLFFFYVKIIYNSVYIENNTNNIQIMPW